VPNIRGRTLILAFATLDVALLNEGTQETFNRAGSASIKDLTFVRSLENRRLLHGQRPQGNSIHSGHTLGTISLNRVVKGYHQETLNAEEMGRCLADLHFVTEADVSTNADGIADSLENACRAGMLCGTPK